LRKRREKNKEKEKEKEKEKDFNTGDAEVGAPSARRREIGITG
jgi:hypothetical protein